MLVALWTQESAISFEGEHYRFGSIDFQPLRRAARLDGVYVPPGTTLDGVRELLARLRAHRTEAGRGDAQYDVTVVPVEPLDLDVVRRYADAGVDRILFEIGVDPCAGDTAEVSMDERGFTDNLERVAERLLARL
jgi:alkanesulfonate monooxygenase SsuD/methylene tetrahydromethanopterin reductase-like flavin-dependent oxidoreductase (luciferase family)